MTPKEKAIELVDKFDLPSGLMSIERKQCALIAVDEMLDFRNKLYMNEGSLVHKYLLEVKEEIEKL